MIMAKITRSPRKTPKQPGKKSTLRAWGSVAANPRQKKSAKFLAAKSGETAAAKKSQKASSKTSIKPWTPAEVREAFTRFRNANPEPKGELEHLNPYTLLKMLALGEDKVREYIKTIGLYRNKARNVIALSEKLIAEFGGEVPRTR